jgi:cysteine-rich repeat protein
MKSLLRKCSLPLTAIALAGLLFAVPDLAFAQDGSGGTGWRVARWIFLVIGLISLGFMIYAGVLWQKAKDEYAKVLRAKKILLVSGIAFVLSLIIVLIASFALAGDSGSSFDGEGGSRSGSGITRSSGLGGGSITSFAVSDIQPSGEIAIRNAIVTATFSRELDTGGAEDGLRVYEAQSGDEVAGTVSVAGNVLTFVPFAECPDPASDRFCFDESTEYRVEVANGILSIDEEELDCSASFCEASFTTGDVVDTEPPFADITYPDNASGVEPDIFVSVQVQATDDFGVSHGSFSAADEVFDTVTADAVDLTEVLIESEWDTSDVEDQTTYTLKVVVTDLAGNTDEDSIEVKVNPAWCYNGALDADQGENAVDCGGECGECNGSVCAADFDCASGSCLTGLCTQMPEIDSLSPGSGAVGNYVTIFGVGFGSADGTVSFTGADGILIPATIPGCSDGWEDGALVVQVPEGAEDGPIVVETADGLTDSTDDENGSIIDDFDVNTLTRPHLCNLTPETGTISSSFSLTGDGFGDTQEDSVILFDDTEVRSYRSWSDATASAVVPSLDAGTYEIYLVADNIYSNALKFTVSEGLSSGSGGDSDTAAIPVISSLSPDDGPIGQYVTVTGEHFGSSVGTVRFDSPTTGNSAVADVDFPDACLSDFWSDTQVMVIVPEEYTNGEDVAEELHTVYLVRRDGEESASVDFSITSGEPSPGICALSPDTGEEGDQVVIYGDNFGSDTGEVTFFNAVSAVISDWSDEEITVSVPGAAATGDLFMTSGEDDDSNVVEFTVGTEEDADSSSSGSSLGEAAYAWVFSTGEIAQTPSFTVACSDDVVSGVPNDAFTSTVCVNANVYGSFTMLMDHSSLSTDSILVEMCDDEDCGSTDEVSGSLSASDSEDATSVTWSPSTNFDTSTTYQVTITTDITSADGVALSSETSWTFTTGSSEEDCAVKDVIISPESEAIEGTGTTTEFEALPTTNDCQVLDSEDYSWSWSIDESFASISEGDCAESSDDGCALATALSEGETDVTAKETGSGIEGTASLTIDFTDPYVTNIWPDCSVACVNAGIGASFNTGMSSTIESDGMLTLYECTNELCLEYEETISTTGTCTEDENGDCTEVSVDLSSNLEADTYYRVILSSEITSESGVALARANFGDDYSWTFSTKNDNSSCAVSRIELSPDSVTLDSIGATQSYTVSAYGDVDNCSVAGQRLTAFDYEWEWQDPIVDDENIASWVTINGSLFDSSQDDIPSGCTASCLSSGSSAFGAICGNGSIESGEECEDGNTTDGDGCSSSCLREGGDSAGTCGDGTLDQDASGAGEDCDDGNTTDGDGCSALCLNEGARSVGSTCGNGSIGFTSSQGGEDCDDGNKSSGDGCSSICLNEGSSSAAEITAVCGDGTTTEPYETCDDSNTTDGDGCSSSCLREGSGDIGTCGDGVVDQDANGAGEDCDDGNTDSDDGCSSVCLAEGSSLDYSTSSVCGDGSVGTGELNVCESGVTGDGRQDPSQTAEIQDTAVLAVDVDEELATATIRVEATEFGLSDEATISLTCTAEEEDDCSDPETYGVSESGCCVARPQIALFPNSEEACRNAAIYAMFDAQMDISTFEDNVYVELDVSTTDDGVCPSDHEVHSSSSAYGPVMQRVWQRMFSLVVPRAIAQTEGACVLPITGFNQDGSDSNFRVMVKYGALLAPEATYTLHVEGDALGDDETTGVLTRLGIGLLDGDSQEFTTISELCTVDSVEVTDTDEDSPKFFTSAGESHAFTAAAYSHQGSTKQEIASVEGVYAFEWDSWTEDSEGEIVDVTSESEETSSITAQETSGEATVVAQVTVTEELSGVTLEVDEDGNTIPTTVAGELKVEAIICESPWPSFDEFPLIDDATGTVEGIEEGTGWMNFSTWYCMSEDGDAEDTLTSAVLTSPSDPGDDIILKEYLLKMGDGSGDAIGIRIASNTDYDSPYLWYLAQGFEGSPKAASVDGFQAIEDGRTTYVSAPNVDAGSIYPNIYVISYNSGASEDTISIYRQLLENFEFTTNVEETAFCYDGTASTGTSCVSDLDCDFDGGEYCADDESKLRRDIRRLNDLQLVSTGLEIYGRSNGLCSESTSIACTSTSECPGIETCDASYPTLPSGTFVRSLDASPWGSWVGNFGDVLDGTLPEDPLNTYNGCGEGDYEEYDAETCVNQVKGTYLCPENSFAYHYRNVGPFSFELAAELEYDSADWALDYDNSDEYDFIVGGNSSSTVAGFTGTTAYCDGSTIWGASDICGDGIVGSGEACELGQSGSAVACTTDDGSSGVIAQICDTDCSGLVDNPSATCVANSCGNGVIEGAEACDDGSFNGKYGFCGNDCTYTASFYCGDGTVAAGEVCDCGSVTVGGKTYEGSDCSLFGNLNGAYAANPTQSCGWACTGPAPYCGDGTVDDAEECDGDTETYSGELCSTGANKGEFCTSDDDCGPTTIHSFSIPGRCGTTSATEACEETTVCLAGNTDTLGVECSADSDCDTTTGANDGECSDALFQTTRTKTCADDGEAGDLCTWNDEWKSISCEYPFTCGDGTIDEGEACDDGNDDNTDSCTNACQANTCGDGYVKAGVESCDDGSENGELCSASYDETCTYCSSSCKLVTSSGAYCGNGEIESGEYCDDGDLPFYYVNADGDFNGTCDPDEEGDVKESTYYCADVGLCEGGDDHGEACTTSGDVSLSSCSGGSCVYPSCADDCGSSCPFSYEQESLQFKSNLLNARRNSSVNLQVYDSSLSVTSITTATQATVYVPACESSDGITLDIDDTNRGYPDVEVMFVFDRSKSMNTTMDSGDTRLEVLYDAAYDSVDELFDAYDTYDAWLNVGYTFFGGEHGVDADGDGEYGSGEISASDYFGKRPATESSVKTAMASDLSSVITPLVGTPIYVAIDEAIDKMGATNTDGETAEERYLVIFTDGDIYNADLEMFPETSSSIDWTDTDGDGELDDEEYMRAVSARIDEAKADGIEVFSVTLDAGGCNEVQMQRWSSMDCTASGSTCQNASAEGNYSCVEPDSGITYAFSGSTAKEVATMYQSVVDAILDISIVLEFDGDARAVSVPSGTNQTVYLPDSFTCGSGEQQVAMRTTYGGGGSIKVSNMRFNMCPAE